MIFKGLGGLLPHRNRQTGSRTGAGFSLIGTQAPCMRQYIANAGFQTSLLFTYIVGYQSLLTLACKNTRIGKCDSSPYTLGIFRLARGKLLVGFMPGTERLTRHTKTAPPQKYNEPHHQTSDPDHQINDRPVPIIQIQGSKQAAGSCQQIKVWQQFV
jgi:hypothetical protein